MKKRNLPKTRNSEKIRREKDPIPWRYCLLTLVCGALLVGGFFLAARTHFSSVDFGIKNSSLKKQLEDLEAEKRRLILLKETALSPAEIKKAAKKLGLTEETAASLTTFGSKIEEKTPPSAKKTEQPTKKLIEKTVEQKPVEKIGKDGAVKDKPSVAKKDAKEKSPTRTAK